MIVAETSRVVIYDGDDPDLPMWMVINRSGTTISSIFALNGNLIIGMSDNAMDDIRFISDLYAYRYTDYLKVGYGAIVNRGGVGTFTGTQLTSSGTGIVNVAVNDVAMTVLPNAPIDDATGLPIPTIAVATDGGVSVIKDDGTVVDLYRSAANQNEFSHQVAFDENNSLFFSWGTTNGQERHLAYYETIPSSDDTQLTDNYYPSANLGSSAFGNSGQGIIANNGRDFAGSDDKQYLTRLYHTKESATSNTSSVANITSDYNTGWMHGNIKGAFLSDTDTTAASSSSLISGNNSTFDTGTGNWTAPYQSTIAAVSGQLQMTATAGNPYARLYVTVEVGKTYRLDIDSISHNFSTAFQIWFGNASGLAQSQYGAINMGNGASYSKYFTATTTTLNVQIVGNGSVGQVGTVDNVFLYELEEDRSVNNKGLQVFGTINKSAVATGAELVAYHGVSSTNYLKQPYNSDLNFGTGDFSIFVWVLKNTLSSNHYIIDRAPDPFSSTGRSYFVINSNGYHRYRLAGGSEVTGNVRAMTAGVYNHIGFVRKGGAMEFWMNGELVQTVTGSNASASFDDGVTGQVLTVDRYANGFALDYTFDRMALLRISGSVPSAEQIKKIYEDEKVLFQENAKCTLYGSSDAVTALAYDDSTNILYAGTSSGRSDFQGLRRINNTTTAVTTAMSASNGLVAEQ